MSKLPVTDKFIVYADIPVLMPKYLAPYPLSSVFRTCR
jgi:hypothetical protein